MPNESTILHEKLDIIIRLLAASLVREKSRREQLQLLAMAGLKPKEIASLLGTSPNTISVELYKMRKKIHQGGSDA